MLQLPRIVVRRLALVTVAKKFERTTFLRNRVTDHRIGLTLHKLERVLEGDLDELIAALSVQ